jgi:hypothetical protein
VLLGEPDAPAILADLPPFERHVASRVLAVELRRLARRHGQLATATALLGGVALIPLSEAILLAAETLTPAGVSTLDAIHRATALELAGHGALDAIMTYYAHLADAAGAHGLAVLAPA